MGYFKSILLLKMERKEGIEKGEKKKIQKKKISVLTLTLWMFSL